MALFTDGPISGLEDLTAQDSQLLNVANVEGIDVTQKVLLAQEEIGLDLTSLLNDTKRAETALWLAPQATIRNVVVTPALRLWHTFRTLVMVYEDAYCNQLNDRYGAKRDRFKDRAKGAYDKLLLLGLGIVWSPVRRAAVPQVVSAAGNLPDGTYYVAMTWTNNKSEEGAPSIPAAITTTESTLQVQPAGPPACAAGWNVYAGTDPAALFRQNGAPLATAQTWLQPNTISSGASASGWGQLPNYMMALPRTILRG